MGKALAIVPRTDRAAVAIGKLYRAACNSLVDSSKHYLECGRLLTEAKAPMKHGEWKPWLSQNAETLGFDSRQTAFLLMKAAANVKLTLHLDDGRNALAINKTIWGNKDSGQLVQQSLSNEHYTPVAYLEAARAVLGDITLDPASCEEANKAVRAHVFFTEDNDGLTKGWGGNVWLNPPYGRLPGAFITKFVDEFAAGNIEAGIILVNAHCTDTEWFKPLWDGVLCFTDHRINFYGDDERSGSTHGSVFVYFGPNENTFAAEFKQFGPVVARLVK
jgi:hypothetical protein